MLKNISPSTSGQEKKYLDLLKQHPNQVFMPVEDAPIEGFEYFASNDYRVKVGNVGNLITDKFSRMPKKHLPRFIGIFRRNIPFIFAGRKRSFWDVSDILKQLDETGDLGYESDVLMESYPNYELWDDLITYAWDTWQVKIGFTEVPQEVIFRDKAVLFRYALVVIQEMEKEKIDLAPSMDAGEEVLHVYTTLGIAVNEIARWLRKEYAVRCQANHPLGGLVCSVPLAGKAGMGWMGSNGLLITPEFGQRQRIAPIFLEAPLFEFTDSDEHRWIEDYCEVCGLCRKKCPTGAILDDRIVTHEGVAGIGELRSGIDREKCYPYFNQTLGCSVCVKVCPFSKGGKTYDTLKEKVLSND